MVSTPSESAGSGEYLRSNGAQRQCLEDEPRLEVLMKREVCDELRRLGLDLAPDTSLFEDLHRSCRVLREHLASLTPSTPRVPLTGASFWDVAPKYRLDILLQDMPAVMDDIAYSIGLASWYLPRVWRGTKPLHFTFADQFFWYHIDAGFRFVSSGWDRIALLLDLAFELDLRSNCNLGTVLQGIAQQSGRKYCSQSFKNLKRFRDDRMKDLEGKKGTGLRHEATHIMAPSTRLAFEYLETVVSGGKRMPRELQGLARRDMLVEHHGLYVAGVRDAIRLVSERWPQGGS